MRTGQFPPVKDESRRFCEDTGGTRLSRPGFAGDSEFKTEREEMMKRFLCMFVALCAMLASAETYLNVTNVSCRQRYPWNGKVDIDVEVQCDDPTTNVSLYVTAKDLQHNKTLSVKTIDCADNVSTNVGELAVRAGRHRLTWDCGVDNPNVASTNVAIEVQGVLGGGLYLVIDLSDGPDANSYPISYLNQVPEGGWTDEYKTDKLVLRRIEPGTFTMGDQVHGLGMVTNITISTPFYIGVFEVTQRQWELVKGTRPSFFRNSDYYMTRPVEKVSYSTIRGSSLGAQWPRSVSVDPNSFIGELRSKIVLKEIDLPTDAQWEYAARAGTTTDFSNGVNWSWPKDDTMDLIGRYWNNGGSNYWWNGDTRIGTAKVGSFPPNKWGLYDMHGNVYEWCCDWYGDLASNVEDPVGADTGTLRVLRGGSWFEQYSGYCSSDYRNASAPNLRDKSNSDKGFRLCCVVNLSTYQSAGISSYFAVDGHIDARIAGESEKLTYSTMWNGGETATIKVGGKILATESGEGYILWDTSTERPGRITLSHTSGDETLTADFVVFDNDVEEHRGILPFGQEVVSVETNGVLMVWTNLVYTATWKADKVHLIAQDVTIPEWMTLDIESGTVVKFLPGTTLTVSSNAHCNAKGVIFTHVNDDTIGGDMLFDGGATQPVVGEYAISGVVSDDETTEYRYITHNTTLTGTLNDAKRLSRGSTYRVSGTFTIANGATLTIPAGTVLKMEQNARINVSAGGRLISKGTRIAPIIITSIKDDSYGGDSNEDGDASTPAGGDWQGIWVNGTAEFEYTTMMYAGPDSERGIVQTQGSGRLMLNNCVVAHAKYDGLWNWGGFIAATNTVVMDTGWATAPYRGSQNEYVNCIFYGNNVGLCYWSHWSGNPVYKNCIFAECGLGWCETANASYTNPQFRDAVKISNSLFYNPDGYGLQTCDRVGKNGNIWGDPLFVDAANGDFRIREGSPCVDAADSSAAPELDYFGQPRITFTGRTNDTELAEGPLADIGICEVMPRDVTSDIDLVPEAVRTEKTAMPGQLLFVKWEVRNQGGAPVDATWRDTVSLVSQDGREVVLGDKTTKSAIAVGGSVFCSGYFTVPAMAEGTWYPKVNVNSYHDIFEGSLTANNALVGASGVEVAVKEVESEGEEGVVNAGVPTVKKITLPETGGNRMVRIKVPAGVTIRWGFGFVPTGNQKSGTLTSNGQDAIFRVPDGVTDVYVSMESDDGAEYDLSLEEGQVVITGVSPNTLPSSGEVTITIDGAGFTEDSKVYLVNGAVEIAPKLVQYVSAQELVATIDCGKLTAGTQYDVSVIGDENTATATKAVSVAAVKGEGKIVANLIFPSSVRQGREVSAYVEYSNVGNADAPLPVFVIASCGDASLEFRLPFENGFSRERISVIGLGDYKGFGVAPGTVYQIPFIVKSSSPGTVEVKMTEISSSMQEDVDNARAFLSCVSPKVGHSERFNNVLRDYCEFAAGEVNYISGFISRMVAGSGAGDEIVAYIQGDDGWMCIGTGTCNAYGGYSIPVETNGVCRVLCPAIGYISNDFVLKPNEVARIDIVDATPRRLTASTSVTDVGCVLVCRNDQYSIERRVSLLSGNVKVDSLLPLKWHVWIESPEGDIVSEQKEVDLFNGNGTVNLSQLAKHNIKVKVVDIAGESVDGSSVSIIGDFGEIKGLTRNGVVEFEGVHRREIIIVVTDGDFVDTYACISGSDDEVEIVLDPGFLIEGFVDSDEYGDDGFVVITGDDYSTTARLDTNGHYQVKVPAGEYSIQSLRGDVLKTGVQVGNSTLQNAYMTASANRRQVVSENDLSSYEWNAIIDGLGLKALYEWRYTLWSKEKRSPAWLLRAFIGPLGLNTGYHVGTQHFDNESYYADLARENTSCSNPYYKVRDAFTELIKLKMGSSQDPLQRFYGETNKRTYCANFGSWGNIFNPLWGAFRGTYRTKYVAEPHLVKENEESAEYSVDVVLTVIDRYAFRGNTIKDRNMAILAAYGWATEYQTEIELKHSFTCNLPRKKEPSEEEGLPLDRKYASQPQSCDPNEMAGPLGLGDPETERYVKPGEWMTYTVYFENRADATAAAQEVRVTNPLSEYLDWSTFEMGEVAFNNQIDLGLSGKRNGTSEVVMKGTNTLVRTQLTLDDATGTAEWYLRIVDPTTATGWPEDVFAGFLPPNDETFRGEGHLTYRVKVRDDAPHGVRIANSASIVFDYNEPIETDPSWWNTVARTLEAGFVEPEVMVDEGGTATVAVRGGSAERETSVQVSLAYQTASAADLDLKNAKVDGATPKGGVKFPLTLTWAAGEIGAKTITIPVKADRAVENEELFTLQLANAQGMGVGDASYCTVTVRDANAAADYAAKQGKTTVRTKKGVPDCALSIACVAMDGSGEPCGYTTGQGSYYVGCKASLKATARPGWAFAGWGEVEDGVTNVVSDKASWSVAVTDDADIIAFFDRIPYVRGLAHLADRGKVTGSGYCPAGKKVTLRATANRGYVFEGWYGAKDGNAGEIDLSGQPVAKTPALIVDRTARPAKSDARQTVITEVDGSVTYFAKFITNREDIEAVSLDLDGVPLSAEDAFATNLICGVAVDWPVVSGGLSATTVRASGLPAGLKLVQDRATRAYSVVGVPTTASKVDKSDNVKPSVAKFTVTTAGRNARTFVVEIAVSPLPTWAVGSFDGAVQMGDIVGAASMTVAANGRVSGKYGLCGTNWTFSASGYTEFIDDDIETNRLFALDVMAKSGRLLRDLRIEVTPGWMADIVAYRFPDAWIMEEDARAHAESLGMSWPYDPPLECVTQEVSRINCSQANGADVADAALMLHRGIWKDRSAKSRKPMVDGLFDWWPVLEPWRNWVFDAENFPDVKMSVATSGRVSFAGKLPDGVRASSSTTAYLVPESGHPRALFIVPTTKNAAGLLDEVVCPHDDL